MADGPDFSAMQSLINSSQNNNGGGDAAPTILRGILPATPINVGKGLSLEGGGLNFAATFKPCSAARPGVFAKLLADMGLTGQNIIEGMKKCADAGPVRQINSIEEIRGSGPVGGSSGGFVDYTGSRGGQMEV